MNQETKQFPQLYMKASTGKVKQWQVTAGVDENDIAYIEKSHGLKGHKIQTNRKLVKKGKNIGRSNETSPYEQACLKAKSAYNKQLDKGYNENPDGGKQKVLPMLAQDFNKAGHRIVYPAWCQPKLNGVRCLAKKISETEIDYQSRKGKSYNGTLAHLTPHLLKCMETGDIFDGELYIHGQTFQQIVRLVKKYRPGKTENLQYWVYDHVDEQSRMIDRFSHVQAALDLGNGHTVIAVQTEEVSSMDGVKAFHDYVVKQGFEGAIIRNAEAVYAINKRSKDLQKYKEFFDKEVKIIGGKEGTGLESGCVIFEVEDEFGNKFFSRPRGSRSLRRQWLKNLDQIIGKNLTIRYQELSESNTPIFSVGICIRDYE